MAGYDKLLERLRDWPRVCVQYDGSVDQLHDEAADAIEELQEKLITTETDLLDLTDALKELSKPKWIPVSERLPEQGKRYLVIRYDYVTKTPFIDILWHDAHDLWWNRLYKGQYNVSYWMPLPEPPKERA